ncbi:MAG: amino acid adenylation domain-containing protein, partial [Monoglobaceae bacterium]
DEQQKLLYAFNDTAVDYPRDKCVHQLFEEQSAKTPDKTAVVACDRTLTYQELNEEANRIAHSLIEKGVGVGDIVAFMLPRRSYLIATMLGILKSGAAYMPIDPDYPQDRIDYMLSDSGAKLCITDTNISELLNNDNTNNPCVDMTSESLCYCIYTSGSTGKPKGTLLTHANVVNYVNNNNNNNVVHRIIKDSYKSIVSVTTVGFDIFVTESLLPLANGMEILLASEEQAKFQSELNLLIKQNSADVIQTTPTKMKSLIVDKQQLDYLKTVKVIILGGEALEKSLVEELKEITEAEIFNIYGPTETTVWSTNAEIKEADITIGKPIANTQIYIVDKYMCPTPIGVTGELCIAGDGVGAGYLNRPELTAEKFIDNPFGKGKLYKTGDLAYWREDGNIVYVGRNDFQVKIRGLRIELGEIENAISGIDGISQAVVVVRKNIEGRQLICAFYTGEEKPAKEIRSQIGTKLPKYMLPHIFTHLDEMPLTSSGKINRKALPEVGLYAIDTTAEYVAPENEQQKEICRLIESVLGCEKVGINDNFFDIGGDSLKAIEFVSEAHNEGIYFKLQNVFDYPTVKALNECIENGDKQNISFDDIDFNRVNRVLEKNKLDYITAPKKSDVGNVLIAGATGYLGIHILADFLDNDKGIAYCMVRGKDKNDSTKRLNELLSFYFDDKYVDMNRIEVICADLQKDKFGLSDEKYADLLGKVDTVINCAASVKHYGSYQYFYDVNVETVKRLIEFCKKANAKLIHTSTISVSGNSFAEEFSGSTSKNELHFYESDLYIGQPLDNVYARSKFEAEKAVLEAIADGLKANIMRMGQLTNRYSDGKFQKNYESNAFLKRIRAVLELGVAPDYLGDLYAEFTPIDEAANAVMTIARHFSNEQTVFHINSIKVVYLDKLLESFNNLGFKLKAVDGAKFTQILRQTAKQADTEHIFETFINDIDENDMLNYDSNIRIENDFTVRYLKQLGFEWHDIDIEYLRKYVEYFRKIGYLK